MSKLLRTLRFGQVKAAFSGLSKWRAIDRKLSGIMENLGVIRAMNGTKLTVLNRRLHNRANYSERLRVQYLDRSLSTVSSLALFLPIFKILFYSSMATRVSS